MNRFTSKQASGKQRRQRDIARVASWGREIADLLRKQYPELNDPDLYAEAIDEREQAIMRGTWHRADDDKCRCSACLCDREPSWPQRGGIVYGFVVKISAPQRILRIVVNADGRDLTDTEACTLRRLGRDLDDKQRNETDARLVRRMTSL